MFELSILVSASRIFGVFFDNAFQLISSFSKEEALCGFESLCIRIEETQEYIYIYNF